MVEHDLTRARQLVKESGYDGRSIVVLHVTDIPFLNAAAMVTRQRLERIGFKVILKAMDWSASLAMLSRKEPPDYGGWNLFHTWTQGWDITNPVNAALSGAGPRTSGPAGRTSHSSTSSSPTECARLIKRNGNS
jgi:peptide/nickel transport system substrate-binding protein